MQSNFKRYIDQSCKILMTRALCITWQLLNERLAPTSFNTSVSLSVMEESSESHMETDVSSTTEDVPETQEVTGSIGNVEMVIVVEKVKEEEMNSEVQNEKEISLVDNSINEVSKSCVESPQMDTEVQIISIKSPAKNMEVESLSKTESPQKPVNKDLALDNEIELSAQLQQTENVDSSVKDNLQTENIDKSKSLESSPNKVQNNTISLVETMSNKVQNNPISLVESSPKKIQNNTISLVESSPNKVQNNTISLVESSPNKVQNNTVSLVESSPHKVQNNTKSLVESSPNKVQNISVEKSPMKEAPKPIQISPNKELQISESQMCPPTNEPLLVEKVLVNGKIQNSDTNAKLTDSHCKTTSSIIPIDITVERDTSDDSQIENNSIETNCSDTSEKEHNKSISRELKSLINSAKESKIISECTQLKSKTRKSRSALDNSSTSLNTSVEADKIQGIRRHSNNSQKSSCSEKSEKVAVKRSMRSQNPEFVSKVKQFLNSVTGKGNKDKDSDEDDEVEEKNTKDKGLNKDKNYHVESSVTPLKMKKVESVCSETFDSTGKLRSDSYCWRCHWVVEQSAPMPCTVCPRSFHYKCLSSSERNKINAEKSWVCPECMLILQAESSETRSQAMKKVSPSMLRDLLKYALERLMDLNGVEPFMQPVDRANFPDYDKYVVHPMDLSLMQTNIAEGRYGSTVAFLSDVQWILHNSIIFNTLQSKLTAGARALVRSCRTEMGEIEACPECYAAAHARRPTWFTDVCTTPHILLWAKLKGFPYWPAKGMSVSNAGHVDVRFFGAHDRAWVPAKDCFLYSEKDPNNFRTKRQDIIDSMHEAEQHILNISKKYGKFIYPPFKTQFNPNKLNEHLKMMIPSFEGEVRTSLKEKSNTPSTDTKEKSRSNSKSSKCSYNDGEMSENEDVNETEQPTTVASRKMADGAEIAREDEDTTTEKLEIMDVDTTSQVIESVSQKPKSTEMLSQSNKISEPSRKRRRSDLEEAVLTIIESSNNPPEPKRRKHENKQEKEKKKSEECEPSSSKEINHKPNSDDFRVDKSKKSNENTNNDEIQDKDNEPSSSTRSDPEKEVKQRVTPIRIALVQKDRRHNLRTNTAKEAMAKILNPTREKDRDKDHERNTPTKQKHSKTEKNGDKTPKEEKLTRSEKRRNSRNKSITNTPKADKNRHTSAEKKSEKIAKSENETTSSKEKPKEVKDIPKENSTSTKENNTETESLRKDKISSPKPNSEIVTSVKDRLHFDDDTSLAVIARESRTVIISNNTTGLPTISCVRSLSTTAQNTGVTITKSTSNARTSDGTMTTNSDLCLLIPTSADSVKNVKDASKLQKQRNDAESMVGRVGVRAFARMTSPEKSPNNNDNVEIEIKAEPIDVDDADRQIEKLNLMNAFRLRPVNPPAAASNLREVRINKVLVTPLNAKKTAGPKPVEVRPRAKKTFPQPKKPEDGQLNSKNSMVYIPIQPPMTQAPIRPQRIVAGPCLPKPSMASSTLTNCLVNTVTTPVMQVSSISSSPSAPALTTTSSKTMATLGPVPSSVHTVPMMTSVNGQWMFSFQPVMSVGALETSPSPPILNGVADRNNTAASLIPLPNSATQNNQQLQGPSSAGNASVQTMRPATAKTPGENNTPGEPPRLQQRPALLLLNPLDPNAPIGNIPTPSSAGPLTAKLNQNAVKLTDFFRTLLEDSLEKLDDPATQLTTARLQLEQAKWKHQTEIEEIKHNQELTIAEMRALFEKEKARAVAETRRAAQLEMEAAVKLAKSKQWCANCSQEAQFYCCWNTSYCDYPCQRAHWSQHFNVCAQQRQDGSNANEPPAPTETRLQAQPDNMPKNTAAPALTVGGKLAPSRVYTQDPHNVNTQKNAIIVSMVEDQSGNQTMKCLGTYKSPAPAQNMSPIILNKQIMNSEENANNKKVVSSGGYLIVGGGSNSSAVVTPTRRTHTIQYFS
ncbi:unnamed protein product [Arctia plantaginis]|uniref:Protein kinase C-binding protein 1 n=1 Tax=Arctia plantaginis TaxID=874455 RepID=A0A8S1AKH5_ARCPL|nr:unnamed protein product [Arctia plantaginis]